MECGWHYPTFVNMQCFGNWQMDSPPTTVPTLAIPSEMPFEARVDHTPKSPTSKSEDSAETVASASDLGQVRAQTASRAAKRQRGRERRKIYKALKRMEPESEQCKSPQAFDDRVAAVAAELKVV